MPDLDWGESVRWLVVAIAFCFLFAIVMRSGER
jgi:hypothetical protein